MLIILNTTCADNFEVYVFCQQIKCALGHVVNNILLILCIYVLNKTLIMVKGKIILRFHEAKFGEEATIYMSLLGAFYVTVSKQQDFS